MRLLLLLSVLGFTLQAHASYRVYKLKIQHYDNFGKVRKVETTLSNLDHLQYEHYHGGYRWAHVELLDTWYCPGDTSRKKYCAKPRFSERSPASVQEKRSPLPYTRQPVIP